MESQDVSQASVGARSGIPGSAGNEMHMGRLGEQTLLRDKHGFTLDACSVCTGYKCTAPGSTLCCTLFALS